IPAEQCQLCRQPGDVVHGHIDGILQDIAGVERLYEHKAINHFSFVRYWEREIPYHYIAQPCAYLIGLKKMLVDLNEIGLLIKNKNTAQFLEYLIEYDVEKDVAKIKSIEHSGFGEKSCNVEVPSLVESAVENWQKTERYYQTSRELGKPILPVRPFDH